MLAVMSEQQTGTQAAPAGTDTATGPGEGDAAPFDWGRVLDFAGILAGVLLVVIVVDVWTDGRVVSRWLLRRGPAPDQQPEEVPVEPGA